MARTKASWIGAKGAHSRDDQLRTRIQAAGRRSTEGQRLEAGVDNGEPIDVAGQRCSIAHVDTHKDTVLLCSTEGIELKCIGAVDSRVLHKDTVELRFICT